MHLSAESVAVTVCSFTVPNELMACVCACVCVSVLSGASVFLHLHSVLTPSCVRDRSVPHSMAPVWFLASWCTHRGLVYPQQVGNNCVFIDTGDAETHPDVRLSPVKLHLIRLCSLTQFCRLWVVK